MITDSFDDNQALVCTHNTETKKTVPVGCRLFSCPEDAAEHL